MPLVPLPGDPLRVVLMGTIVLIVCIAAGSWVSPAAWWAPDEVTAAHATIQSCAACHAPFRRMARVQCLGCHTAESFAARAAFGVGAFHQTLLARGRECLDCHTEHRGRQAPITIGREGNPHGDVVFALTATRSCTQCHAFASDMQHPPVVLDVEPVRRVLAKGSGKHEPGRFVRCASCHGAS